MAVHGCVSMYLGSSKIAECTSCPLRILQNRPPTRRDLTGSLPSSYLLTMILGEPCSRAISVIIGIARGFCGGGEKASFLIKKKISKIVSGNKGTHEISKSGIFWASLQDGPI